MDGFFGASFAEGFEGLSKLLSDQDQIQGGAGPTSPPDVSRAKAGPAGIGPQGIFPDVKVAEPKAVEDPNAIWAADEVCDVLAYDADDGRKVPEYSFYYKQAVQTGDVYLGLDPMGKDPTSNSCEDLVLTVELPDATSASDIDVDLASSSITLLTSKHRLSTYLPHEVDSDKSIAQWDAKKHQLKITMRRRMQDAW